LAKQIRLSRIRHVELRHLLVATFLPEVVEADADVFPSQAIPSFKQSLSVLHDSTQLGNQRKPWPTSSRAYSNIISSFSSLTLQQTLEYRDMVHLCEALP
jgi:hypothetical protein